MLSLIGLPILFITRENPLSRTLLKLEASSNLSNEFNFTSLSPSSNNLIYDLSDNSMHFVQKQLAVFADLSRSNESFSFDPLENANDHIWIKRKYEAKKSLSVFKEICINLVPKCVSFYILVQVFIRY